MSGLPKYSGSTVRKRASSPKLLAHDTALMSAIKGLPLEAARADGEHWGRLVETAVGAHLLAAGEVSAHKVHYWRDGGLEVDYVVEAPDGPTAIEVKSGRRRSDDTRGTDAFVLRYQPRAALVVGQGGVPLADFLAS